MDAIKKARIHRDPSSSATVTLFRGKPPKPPKSKAKSEGIDMKFEIDSNSFFAENCIENILINPELPEGFYITDLSERGSLELDMWMNRSYVVAEKHEAFASGIRYSVWCLDGGSWDRPTSYGHYHDIDSAIIRAKELCK